MKEHLIEEGVDHQFSAPISEVQGEMDRILQLTDRIDQLAQVTQFGRGMRLGIPVFFGMALGAKALFDLDWVFLMKAAVGLGIVMGYTELVTWWYSRKINALEQEIEEAARPAS